MVNRWRRPGNSSQTSPASPNWYVEVERGLLPDDLTRLGGLGLSLERLEVVSPFQDPFDFDITLFATVREVLVGQERLDIELVLPPDPGLSEIQLAECEEVCQRNPGVRFQQDVAYHTLSCAEFDPRGDAFLWRFTYV